MPSIRSPSPTIANVRWPTNANPGRLNVAVRKRLGDRHAHAVGEAGSERPCRGLDPEGMTIFRVARSPAAPLPEMLQLFDLQPETCQVEQRVEQHGPMSRAQYEPVAIRPYWIHRGPKRRCRLHNT